MKLLDLFAGIGGFSLAAHWMGWTTEAFVEKDEFCQKVLAKNFPDVPIYDDITEFDGRKYHGKIDIITGGFPCQPFSQAGKRKGKYDERYLFPEMLRVIKEVRPRWVVAENVRGILSVANGDVFADICTSLEIEGYEVWPCGVPASAVEAPHERQRIWIIATSGAYSNDQGLQRDSTRRPVSERKTTTRHAGSTDRNPWNRWKWDEAATSLCRMGDGVSDELDLVGSRDKRVPRLKALGNSIVPTIAYEIFTAIARTEEHNL